MHSGQPDYQAGTTNLHVTLQKVVQGSNRRCSERNSVARMIYGPFAEHMAAQKKQ